jgi:hypothetical protein
MEQEQKKSILIIKANTQSLLAAEGFLRNRDWKIKSTANLKEALIYLVQEQPAFVMISVDHPNKKVQKLFKVLAAAFPVCVIGFAEESATASYKALNSAPTEYQIYPPITGPAIERIVNKYHKDQLTKPTLTAAQRAAGETGDASSMINIKGSNGFNAANAQSLLAQMLSGDGADLNLGDAAGNHAGTNTSTSSSANGSSTMMPPSNSNTNSGTNSNSNTMLTRPSKSGPAESAFEQMNADDERRLAEKKAKAAAYVPKEQKPGAQGNSAAYSPPDSQTAKTGSPSPREDSSTNGTSKGHLQKGAAFGKVDLAKEGTGTDGKTATEEDLKSSLSNHFNRSAKGGPTWEPAKGHAEKNKERPRPETDDGGSPAAEGDSLILRGTTAALEKSCIQLSKNHNQGVELTSNMACIVIESSRFSGYLITAMGKNKVIDNAFMKKIQMRLYNFLKEHGEKVTNGESMQLILKQVPFMPWAVDQAEFLRRSTHMGDEVAMAFFPRAEIRARFGESVDEEMAAVHLHEFEGDTMVDFNVYIHLPKNNKYVLYTPRGGVFYDKQKTRLSGQGISHLHVLKAEMQDLDKYRAENYLNDSIEDFQKKDRSKKSA